MANGTRVCKVCGAEYEYCRTKYRDTSIFRYQDVACCAEHGSEYFAAVLASRSSQPVSNNETATTPSVSKATVPDDSYEKPALTNETATGVFETGGDSEESSNDEHRPSNIDI